MTARAPEAVVANPSIAAMSAVADAEQQLAIARAGLGRTLTDRRLALGLDVAQLARIAKVDRPELSRLERGIARYRAVKLAQTVDAALTEIERQRRAS